MTTFPGGTASKPAGITTGQDILASHMDTAWDEIIALENVARGATTLAGTGATNILYKSGATGAIPLAVQGFAGQTADLLQIGSSASVSDRLKVTAGGQLVLPVATSSGGVSLGTGSNIWTTGTNLRLKPQTDATTAVEIRDSVDTNTAVVVDTNNRRVGIGNNTAPSAALHLLAGTTPTVATSGIQFGTDTNLYRSAADMLKTDDSLTVGTNLTVTGTSSFTGVPSGPTAAADTNSTQFATTAFVVGQAGTSAPVMDGSATVGTSLKFARADHVHPTDTTRAPLASPTLTGSPAAPTPSVITTPGATGSTSIATTAFVMGQAESVTLPGMNNAASAGTSSYWSRSDHIHPVDTSRAPLASPTFTGTPLAPTAVADTNTTQIATTAYVIGQAGSTLPVVDGTAAVGTSLKYARADHVHPTDTTRAPLASPNFTGTPQVDGSNIRTVANSPATSTNTTGALVVRDGSGNFSAGTISANLTGTASLATKVSTYGFTHVFLLHGTLSGDLGTDNPTTHTYMPFWYFTDVPSGYTCKLDKIRWHANVADGSNSYYLRLHRVTGASGTYTYPNAAGTQIMATQTNSRQYREQSLNWDITNNDLILCRLTNIVGTPAGLSATLYFKMTAT